MIKINKKMLFFLIASFIFAYISGGNLPYSIFYLLSVTIVLGMIYMFLVKKSLYAKFQYDNVVFYVSDKVNIKIVVVNSWIIPTPYVYVESKMLGRFIEDYRGDFIFLNGKDSRCINNEITFTKRGIYDFDNISLQANDLFCIFKSVKNIHNKLSITVYPKLHKLNDMCLSGRDDYENIINSKRGNDDFTLIKDIRKYNIGDDLKKVHWKLSAKHGELYVKNFDLVSGRECNLLINMDRDNLLFDTNGVIEENMVDFSASIAKYMMVNRIKTKIFIHAKHNEKLEVESEEEFLELMEYLLKCKSDGNSEFTSYIKSNLQHIPKGNFIGIVSIAIDDNLRDLIINLKNIGYRINIFYHGNSLNGFKNTNFVNNAKLLKSMGIDCIKFKDIIEKVK